MSVTAAQLSKSGARGHEINAVVSEQLRIIDDKLRMAERVWGKNVLTYELPLSMLSSSLEKNDAQRLVYTMIITSLEERGFETKILLEDDRSLLFIAWVTDLGSKEIAAMNSLLKSRIIKPEEIETFMTKVDKKTK